jgi:hypothetical protein
LPCSPRSFDDNLLDATNAFGLYVTDARELSGVPESVLAEARAAAESEGKAGWKLTLRMPCFLPVLTHADSRALRATMHRAFATRASDLGANEAWDNTAVIRRILKLRREAANLLGYADFAALSLVPKMAKSVGEVLAVPARPRAPREAVCRARLRELKAYASSQLGLDDLQPWDRAYASEKLKTQRYAFSEQELRRYFPEEKVLAGLFQVAETLYGISIRKSEATTWHPDVRFFRRPRPGRARSSASSISTRTRVRASRAARGRTTPSIAVARERTYSSPWRTSTATCPRHRRRPGDVHPRRDHHAVPRIRPRPPSVADARRSRRRFRHPGGGVGCGRASRASSWRISAGNGACCRK